MIRNEKPRDKKVKEMKKRDPENKSLCYTCANSDHCELYSSDKRKCKKYREDM